jgi:hypothetical protein
MSVVKALFSSFFCFIITLPLEKIDGKADKNTNEKDCQMAS